MFKLNSKGRHTVKQNVGCVISVFLSKYQADLSIFDKGIAILAKLYNLTLKVKVTKRSRLTSVSFSR